MTARDGLYQNMALTRHHHDAHRTSKHTVDYKDLTKTDCVHLAPIVGPLPRPGTPAAACHHDEIKKLIADLPNHLQAKYPLMTYSCSLHRKVNNMPLTSILNVVQDEVSFKSLARWTDLESNDFVDSAPFTLLQDLNALWLKPEHFCQTFDRNPSPHCIWTFLDTKCVVCKLGHIARSGPAVTALGALTIAGLQPENWKKSKRMYFFEEWLKSCVEFSYKQEPAILAMWECGTRLRAAREASKSSDPHGPRSYIDRFVAQARSSADGSSRSPLAGSSSVPFQQLYPAATSNPTAGPSKNVSTPQPPTNPRSKPAPPNDQPHPATNISPPAPLLPQPLQTPAQQDYAPFAATSPFANEHKTPYQPPTTPPKRYSPPARMHRDSHREADAVLQESNIGSPFEGDVSGGSCYNFRPAQGLSLGDLQQRRRVPVPSSIYSRPVSAGTLDEGAVVEMYRACDGIWGGAGPSLGV